MGSVNVLIAGPITDSINYKSLNSLLNVKILNKVNSINLYLLFLRLFSFTYKNVITQIVLACKPQRRCDIKQSLTMLYRSHLFPWFHHMNFFLFFVTVSHGLKCQVIYFLVEQRGAFDCVTACDEWFSTVMVCSDTLNGP